MNDKDRYFPREHSALKARNRAILRLYRQSLKDGTPRYTLEEIGQMQRPPISGARVSQICGGRNGADYGKGITEAGKALPRQ